MRPTVEYSRDPLDIDNLPASDAMNLELPVQTEVQHIGWSWIVFLAALGGFLGTLLVRVIGRYLGDAQYFTASVAVSVLVGVIVVIQPTLQYFERAFFRVLDEHEEPDSTRTILHTWTFRRFLTLVLLVPVVWLIARMSVSASTLVTYSLLFMVALVAAARLADQVCAHHVWWLTATLSPDARARIRSNWQRRLEDPTALSTPTVLNSALGSLGDYASAILLLAASFLTALLLSIPFQGHYHGFFIFGLFLVVLATAAFVWNHVGLSLRTAAGLTYDALVNFLSYDPSDTPAPGAFKSSVGTYSYRLAIFVLSMLLLGAASALLTAYYPLAVPMYPQQSADFHRYVQPEAWIVYSLYTAFEALIPQYLVAPLISMGLAIVLVPATVFFVTLLLCGRVLSVAYATIREASEDTPAAANRWDAVVDAIQSSSFATAQDHRERDHLWLGHNAEHGYPVLLHRDILREHAHITGDSGSGKTALALAPMMAQLIRLSGRIKQEGRAVPDNISVLVIDLKGDRALFHGVKEEAERANLPFKWFTNNRTHASHSFNPFLQAHIKSDLTTNQKTEVLVQAMGLNYGEFYGAGYFSSMNLTVLRRYLRAYSKQIHSFEDLSSLVHSPAAYEKTFRETANKATQSRRMRTWQDAGHVFARIDSLAALPNLNITPSNAPHERVLANQIHLSHLLDGPGVAYFNLSSLTESAAVSGVAKLALYTLLTAAELREPGSTAQVYVFIDEFQQVAANNLELVLRQARSKDIGVILANQSLGDLNVPGTNLLNTVETNTAFKQVFRVSSQFQREYLSKASGETIYHMMARTVSDDDRSSVTTSEHIGPRFRVGDIINASYALDCSLVQVSKPSGFTRFNGQLFSVRSSFHIDEQTYNTRTRTPWPVADVEGAGTFIAATHDKTDTPPPAEPQAPASPGRNPKPHPEKPHSFDAAMESFLPGFEAAKEEDKST